VKLEGGGGEKSAKVFVPLKSLVTLTAFGKLYLYFLPEDGYIPCFWNTVANRK
jgi:hypothetical protein